MCYDARIYAKIWEIARRLLGQGREAQANGMSGKAFTLSPNLFFGGFQP
jgi:hypothetical protein